MQITQRTKRKSICCNVVVNFFGPETVSNGNAGIAHLGRALIGNCAESHPGTLALPYGRIRFFLKQI
jgi:hypothetical protein